MFKPGIYTDISSAEYRKIPALNKSSMMYLQRSNFALHSKTERKLSRALAIGTALDMRLFTYSAYLTDIKTHPLKRPHEYKIDDNRTIYYLHPDDKNMIETMHDSLVEHRIAGAILKTGKSQVTLIWIDKDFGFLCKARPDWLCEDIKLIADLKTTKDASGNFKYDAKKYRYMWQAAWYLEGWKALTGCEYEFVFICIENIPPYSKEQIAVYRCPDDELGIASTEIYDIKNKYSRYLAGDFSGYPEDIQDLRLD